MKKYVKPIMESEAFVANEYIGACYYLSCTDCGATDYSKNEFNMSGITDMGGSGVYMYQGTINNVDPCYTETKEGKPLWIEQISERPGNGLVTIFGTISWKTVENAVYFWYSVLGGQNEITNTTFHPAVTGQTDKYTYPAHPNHS